MIKKYVPISYIFIFFKNYTKFVLKKFTHAIFDFSLLPLSLWLLVVHTYDVYKYCMSLRFVFNTNARYSSSSSPSHIHHMNKYFHKISLYAYMEAQYAKAAVTPYIIQTSSLVSFHAAHDIP